LLVEREEKVQIEGDDLGVDFGPFGKRVE